MIELDSSKFLVTTTNVADNRVHGVLFLRKSDSNRD